MLNCDVATPADAGRVLTGYALAPVLSGPAAPPSRPLVEETPTGDPAAQHLCCSSGPRIRRLLVGRSLPPPFVPARFRPMSHGGQNRPVCFERWPRVRSVSCWFPLRPGGVRGESEEKGIPGLGSHSLKVAPEHAGCEVQYTPLGHQTQSESNMPRRDQSLTLIAPPHTQD